MTYRPVGATCGRPSGRVPPGARLRGGRPAFDGKSGGKTSRRGGFRFPPPCTHPLKRPIRGDCGPPYWMYPPSCPTGNVPAAAPYFVTGPPLGAGDHRSPLREARRPRRAVSKPQQPPRYFSGMVPTAARRAKPVQRSCSQGLQGNPDACLPRRGSASSDTAGKTGGNARLVFALSVQSTAAMGSGSRARRPWWFSRRF